MADDDITVILPVRPRSPFSVAILNHIPDPAGIPHMSTGPRANLGHVDPLRVIAGLDPAIHLLVKTMDSRVKPAGDAWGEWINLIGMCPSLAAVARECFAATSAERSPIGLKAGGHLIFAEAHHMTTKLRNVVPACCTLLGRAVLRKRHCRKCRHEGECEGRRSKHSSFLPWNRPRSIFPMPVQWCQPLAMVSVPSSPATGWSRSTSYLGVRAFPGKVDTGFPKGNAKSIESRALSDHGPSDFMVNLNGKRSKRARIRIYQRGAITIPRVTDNGQGHFPNFDSASCDK